MMTIMAQTSGARTGVDVRSVILDTLSKGPIRPAELLEQVQSLQISEARLKDVLATLIEECHVELSPDRFIKLRQRRP